ncbi:two-component sensor histidine kinase [Kitasatospora herbaricolor]|uniref:sensor histidine kinase n=1 Tax=Kitasatospora herbaricolor TaxID=68217 RepID=UPI0019A11EF7|nr:sensor histidine kinase [Kitasatospora herbaricolor]MDQ0309444.1 signal transduction histidine kinase [Kitasatospora herbaricolor]GGV01798.1 two-component sensor histidine kinase [Kitasatospora herbaricolor]
MQHPRRPGTDPDAGWLAAVLDSAFLLLLAASLVRYLSHHPGNPRVPWVLGLSAALAVAQPAGSWLLRTRPAATGRGTAPHPDASGTRSDARAGTRAAADADRLAARRRLLPLTAVVALWVVLVLLAPSFAWCAVPLVYTALRALPARAAIPLVAALTALVVVAQARLAHTLDPTQLLVPPAVAALATAVFLYMERQAARQRALIDDLVRTRRELAATERREGTLAERERLAMEIHDTLAQGLSSQQMLLQAADRTWESDPSTARGHVRTAGSVAARNLAEARRFVHDLAPAELADGRTLDQALRALAERESGESGLPVRFLLDGVPVPLPAAAQSALLRIAQGALANIREHAAATAAALTLSYLGDQVVLDIADNGLGFTPPAEGTGPDGPTGRGHGLPAMRARLRRFGGTLTVESSPGEGTVVSAAIPLDTA